MLRPPGACGNGASCAGAQHQALWRVPNLSSLLGSGGQRELWLEAKAGSWGMGPAGSPPTLGRECGSGRLVSWVPSLGGWGCVASLPTAGKGTRARTPGVPAHFWERRECRDARVLAPAHAPVLLLQDFLALREAFLLKSLLKCFEIPEPKPPPSPPSLARTHTGLHSHACLCICVHSHTCTPCPASLSHLTLPLCFAPNQAPRTELALPGPGAGCGWQWQQLVCWLQSCGRLGLPELDFQ